MPKFLLILPVLLLIGVGCCEPVEYSAGKITQREFQPEVPGGLRSRREEYGWVYVLEDGNVIKSQKFYGVGDTLMATKNTCD